ncbi:MAG: hypothetical protein HN922_04360 [Anaerolineae bacterium]|jgi:hypothetical protein|nr:hypothetical protein [Anaerolineae bacterium]MBT7781348.1 hypothetical protein [Anaerolineae bacterium]
MTLEKTPMPSKIIEKKLPQIVIYLNALTTSIALAIYAYFGLFSRLMGDDYCHHYLVKNKSFFDAVQHHYLTFSNRYMILAIPYLTEKFGPRGQSFLPAITIILWLIALYWLIKELHIAFKTEWNKPTLFLLSSLLIFLTILQAPARFQSIYWEASSINRLVPLVLAIFLFASLLRHIRKETQRYSWSLFYFIITFLIGGFDEMNDTFIFAISFLVFLGIFFWMSRGEKRISALWLTGSIFIASLLSMLVMVVAPHNSARITHPPSFFVFLERILTYPKNFILDSTLTVFPLPTALSLFVAFLIFFLFYSSKRKSPKYTWTIFLSTPLIFYALLMVNFAPSAYAQAYPADRALFGARFLMTLMLFLESALFAFLLPPIKSKYPRCILLFFLAIFSLYPLRAAWQTLNTVESYRQRSIAWDLRDDKIRSDVANGERDIHVQEFDSIHIIKELDSEPNHWVNRCAAYYYGANTISADLNYEK